MPKRDNFSNASQLPIFADRQPLTLFNTLAQLRTTAESNNNLGGFVTVADGVLTPIRQATTKKRKSKTEVESERKRIQEIAQAIEAKIRANPDVVDRFIKSQRFKGTSIGEYFGRHVLAPKEDRKKRRELNIVYKKKTVHQLRRKIRDKNFSYEIVMNLLLNNPNSQLKQSYLNTLNYCQYEYKQEGTAISSKYCNNRFCYSCNRIRTGKMINNYLPVIDRMNDLYFVTLTVPNCKQSVLPETIKGMIKTFQLIKDSYRKRYERGRGEKFSGLRKIECTYNQTRNDYHPHFHIVVSGADMAAELVADWLVHYPECDIKGQDFRPASMGMVKELFKYFTKFWNSKQDIGRNIQVVDYVALNNIFCAIRGIRVFQPFGLEDYKFNDSEDIEAVQKQFYNVAPADCTYSYTYEQFNFIDYETGAALSNFNFSRKDARIFRELLGYNDEYILPIRAPIKLE